MRVVYGPWHRVYAGQAVRVVIDVAVIVVVTDTTSVLEGDVVVVLPKL